jgi:glycerophosphoryl diester phosphodiesterase
MRSETVLSVTRFLSLALLALCFGSCSGRKGVLHPKFPDGGLLKNAVPISQTALDRLAGVYKIEDLSAPLGGEVVLHAAPGTLSIFAQPHDAYAIMKGGCIENGSKVVFEGHWRHPTDSDTGLIRLFVDQPEVVSAICKDTPISKDATASFAGATGNDAKLPDKAMGVAYVRPFVENTQEFLVVSHHGACRTIDDCGAAENSVETIKMAESFGGNIVEVDVRLTADGIPILYHDDNYTPRLSKGTYCHGPVEELTLAQARAVCTLLYGEQIPTLEEALDAGLNQTSLRGVWLDMKKPEAVAPTIKIANKYNVLAKQKKRKFAAVIGMGDTDIVDAYIAAQPPPETPCLVELELDDVRRANCKFWGPRWTRGPMKEDVATMQAEGRYVVYWTIDERQYIDLFLTEGKPNGMLSDRTGLVRQRVQTLSYVAQKTGGSMP